MIKNVIKEMVGFIFRFSGSLLLIREVFCRNKVTIIVYHDPNPGTFKKHIKYLSKHYNFISLTKVVNAMQHKDWSNIPHKSLVITIDDGHKSNYQLLDILKTYNITPTLYLCSHVVNTNRHFWFRTKIRHHETLKKVSNGQRLRLLQSEVSYYPDKEYHSREALSLTEIKEMLPYVEFGSHTKFHPILTNCPGSKCQEEIAESKKYLEELLGEPVEHFSYPNGDYTARECAYAERSGYRSGRTLDVGWNGFNSSPYRLKTMAVQDNASINVLCGQLTGLFNWLHYRLQGASMAIVGGFVARRRIRQGGS